MGRERHGKVHRAVRLGLPPEEVPAHETDRQALKKMTRERTSWQSPTRLPRKVIEDRLKMLQEVVEYLPIGITISDREGRIVYSNPADMEMHGYTADQMLGKPARLFAPGSLATPFSPADVGTGVWRRERVNIRRDGGIFPVELTSVAVRDRNDRFLGMVTACRDLTYYKATEEKMNRLAYYDTVTGLPNRDMFLDRLHQLLQKADAAGTKVTVVFLAVDNLNDINATHGHDFGDYLLREVAMRLTAALRDSDMVARFGGDDFVIILNSADSVETAEMVAERILSLFSRPFVLNGGEIYSSASIGIALFPEDGTDSRTLLKSADTAMNEAKSTGTSRYRFFSKEMNWSIMRRVALQDSLRRGITNQEFFLHYQPQWDLTRRTMTGVEALVRWLSPEYGLLQPCDFIPAAENSDFILPLGEWILRSACTQARKWSAAGFQNVRVAVNISAKQFRQADFVEGVARLIHETGLHPGVLELELTESVIMDQAENTGALLKSLKKMGIRLSIDDFGTGYSSLSYLKHFPIDQIKIDRSFISDINRNADDAAIVEAIISMAHSLKLQVVAEGVENEAQLHFLKRLGCDQVQGFYLGLPVTADDLATSIPLCGASKQRRSQAQGMNSPRMAHCHTGDDPGSTHVAVSGAG